MGERLRGKVALVTGASRGIGKGIARVFAGEGACVVMVSRGEEEGQGAAQEIREAGGEAAWVRADVTVWAEVAAAVHTARERYGRLDILASNAGIFPSTKIEAISEAEWDEVLGVNLKGTFLAVKACLPLMQAQGGGRIILTSSITGPITGYPGWAHYGATKAGMLGFMRTAAIELARHRITINAVLPGNIRTEGLADMGDEYIRTMTVSIPLGTLGEVEDIGWAALFFASDEARFITGQTLVVDGGQILPETLEAINA